MRGKLLERLDFLSDHWVKGDDRPPFSFGGWREEVADDFVEIYKNYLADASKEVIEKIEQSIPRYLKGGELRNQYFVKGYNECKQDVLATLREERV